MTAPAGSPLSQLHRELSFYFSRVSARMWGARPRSAVRKAGSGNAALPRLQPRLPEEAKPMCARLVGRSCGFGADTSLEATQWGSRWGDPR